MTPWPLRPRACLDPSCPKDSNSQSRCARGAMDTVRQWLEQLGLPQYAEVFAENDVDLEALRLLAESDLEKLGVSLGHRKKVLKAIDALRSVETIARQRSPDSYTPKHLAEKILTSRSVLEGERKQVTVLFADIAGFTTLAEQLDPEVVHDIINRCFEGITAEVHRFEGTINQYTGDGVMALFGAPLAHEDSPRRAVHAALGIQRAIRDVAQALQAERGLTLQMRIGVNTGLVVVGKIGDDLRMDYTAVGDTTNLAARLQQMAQPGSVVISATTHQHVAGFFEMRDLGEVSVKGRAPVHAFEVLRARSRR